MVNGDGMDEKKKGVEGDQMKAGRSEHILEGKERTIVTGIGRSTRHDSHP